jgi:hypothetical protein
MGISFIMEIEPVSRYKAYANQLEQVGLAQVLQVYQKAYTRYLKR